MFRITARERRIASATSINLLFITTTSAASMAISLPAPMATPTSAAVSAGASLMPSPTIMVFPSAPSDFITSAFPSGRTDAMTRSTPACAPIACAVRSLSPVTITVRMPISFSRRTAAAESLRIVSATAISPNTCTAFPSSSLAKKRGVLPLAESLSDASKSPVSNSAFPLR